MYAFWATRIVRNSTANVSRSALIAMYVASVQASMLHEVASPLDNINGTRIGAR
jgi:hypothetical protein